MGTDPIHIHPTFETGELSGTTTQFRSRILSREEVERGTQLQVLLQCWFQRRDWSLCWLCCHFNTPAGTPSPNLIMRHHYTNRQSSVLCYALFQDYFPVSLLPVPADLAV